MKTTVAIVGIAAAVAASACHEAPAARERAPRPVSVASVQHYSEGTTLRYSASLAAYEQVSLAFKVSGYVTEVLQQRGADGRLRNVQPGDMIGRGAVLARVREEDFRQAANQAAAQLAEAQAALAKAVVDHERAAALFERASGTKPELDAAVAQLESTRARVEAARSTVAQSRLNLDDVALRSPFDGIVIARNVETGTLAGPSQAAFVVADVRRLKVIFGVPDELVGRVKTGTRLTTIAGLSASSPHEGVVTAVSPQADSQTRLFSVELTVANDRNDLRPGMVATVELPEEGRAPAAPLVVPLSAVVKGSGSGYAVYIVERHQEAKVARLRKVALGDVFGNTIAVRDGLNRGDRVIVTGASLVREGEPVRVVPGA
jgi:RND family efflux transporter MFP subunit